MRILFRDDVHDPRDISMIALANACGVFRVLLSSEERAQVRDRIDLLQRLDLIGRTMASVIGELDVLEDPPPKPPRPKEIPVAPGLPLLGHGLAMQRGVTEFVVRQYRALGPIFRVRAPGRRFVVIAGPEATNFLTSEGKRFFRSREPMANFHDQMDASSSILTMDGVDHVTTRRVQAKGYSARVARDRCEEIVAIARDEIAKWPVGKPVHVLPAIRSIVAEQMGCLMTGYSPRGYTEDLATLIDGLLLSATVSPLIMKLPRFRRARARAIELAERVLAEKQGSGSQERESPDFLDHMLQLRESDPQLVPETNLNLIVLAPFMAGLDTAANTCSFMLYNVLRHPDLMERMTAEADALFDEGLVRGEGLRRLDVSRRAAMETLRLHPVAPAVLRTAANSFEFAGHTVPAGSRVMVATAVGHALEEYFPDPKRFDIDRYTRARAEHRQRGAYAPFGAGNHKCLGSGFAPVQLGFTVATILRDLVLRPLDANHVLRVKSIPTTHPVGFTIRVLGRRAHNGTGAG
jgi:cytochrome P450